MGRATMAELEAGLDPERFARIHRGTLVRVDCVREVVPASHGDYDVLLRDGTSLRLSRRYRARLLP
jgi:two-component system LytT family response regulator